MFISSLNSSSSASSSSVCFCLYKDSFLKCKSHHPFSGLPGGAPHPLQGLQGPAWSCLEPPLVSFCTPVLPHAGCVPPAPAQSALPQIFWLFLTISVPSQILTFQCSFSCLFNNPSSWYHVTLFSFIQHVCHCLFFFLSFCLFVLTVQGSHEQATLPSCSVLCPSGT